MALLTAVTVVAAVLLQRASAGDGRGPSVASLPSERSVVNPGSRGVGRDTARGLVRPQKRLDLGPMFDVAGAAALALMENAAPVE